MTENEVLKAIENLVRTKTLIIIAHRLTTIKRCDCIYLIEKGNIVGVGNYNELVKSNKNFKKIVKYSI